MVRVAGGGRGPAGAQSAVLDDPRDAYSCANDVVSVLNSDYLTHSAQGGGVYVAWAELTDLFETGKTPDAVAHDLLRSAARRWLDRDGSPTYAFQEQWVGETQEHTRAAFSRDGDFWRGPGDS